MKYCSNCGSSQLVYMVPDGDNRERHCCSNCGVIHYDNPKVVTGCLPIWEDKILLAKRAIEPCHGLWNLPAGFLEKGESTQDGAAREVLEETGGIVRIQHLHTVFNLPHTNLVYLFYLAYLESDHLPGGPESLEVELFHPNRIPWDQIAFNSTTFVLKKYLESDDGHRETHLGGLPKDWNAGMR